MGPLKGFKIVEVGGIGPVPFCGQILSDMGAEVIRIERVGGPPRLMPPQYDVWHRGRPSIAIDLSKPEGVAAALKLFDQADGLVEGYRPGVMEKMGLGPDECLKRNPRLVYARMTGWGQDGPLAQAAGHDINYIALAGCLHSIGRPGQPPVPPLNIIGDLGGGGLLLAFGMVCGLLETQKSGQGQVVDTAMVDGAANFMGIFYGLRAGGLWSDQKGTNLLDGGAPFYDAYETVDGRWVCVGSIEPQFYALLLKHTGLDDDPDFKNQLDFSKWPARKKKMAEIFKTKTRDEWCLIMEGSDVCFAPVLTMEEAMNHPHNVARETFVEVGGIKQPGPAPRFSRTKPEVRKMASKPGADTETALAEWGFSQAEIEGLKKSGAI